MSVSGVTVLLIGKLNGTVASITNCPNLLTGVVAVQLTGDVSGLRVGMMKEGFDGAEDDVAETVKAAANSLKQLGVTVEEFDFPPLTDC